MTSILNTADEDMKWHHYSDLMGIVAAGTYEESLYFLPRAFSYVMTHHDEALNTITALVWFTSRHHVKLKAHGLVEAVRDAFRQCFGYWTADFRVEHFDKEACEEKGWVLYHFDHVHNAEVVGEATGDLVEYETHADLAVDFYRGLACNDGDPIKAAWFLECVRSQSDAYAPPKYEPITQLLSDGEAIRRSAAIVLERLVPSEASPTYWTDTFNALGL